jgi:hypothetical protein
MMTSMYTKRANENGKRHIPMKNINKTAITMLRAKLMIAKPMAWIAWNLRNGDSGFIATRATRATIHVRYDNHPRRLSLSFLG